MFNSSLTQEYIKILSTIDPVYLGSNRPVGLSGLFLTSVSEQYADAKNKIMIIGSETAEWNVLKGEKQYHDLQSYIECSMDKHKRYFKVQLNEKNSQGSSFHNFTRAVGRKCGNDGLIYSNLFCFDWKKGSPIRCDHFEMIRRYSEPLLKAQIDILKPDIIIFANGMISVRFRREYFPIGENGVCKKGRDFTDRGIENGHLWEFDLFGIIRSFRIHHPSDFSASAVKAREFLIELLPEDL